MWLCREPLVLRHNKIRQLNENDYKFVGPYNLPDVSRPLSFNGMVKLEKFQV